MIVVKRAYIDIPEGQVHYQTGGAGDPLLLLHQTPLSSDEYSRMMPTLSQSYRVVAMDTLGYGGSDSPPYEYRIEDYARSILNFLNALGIEKTSIIGHHTGAGLAVELAATWPERVDKLVLSGCPYREEAERQEFLSHLLEHSMNIKEDGSFLLQRWQVYKSFCQPGAGPEVWYDAFVAALRTGIMAHA